MTRLTTHLPPPHSLTPHSITEMNRLRDQAYAAALELRREAIRDFWRGADHLLSGALGDAQRGARRLAARLRRRECTWPEYQNDPQLAAEESVFAAGHRELVDVATRAPCAGHVCPSSMRRHRDFRLSTRDASS